MAVQLCETVDIYGYSFTGNYYFPKVHNGSPVDKATGKMKKGLPKGHLVIYKAPKVPKDAGWGLPHQENEDQYGSQLQVEQEPEYGRGGKRRLQAIAARGHPWDAEKACTARLSQLPTITWHQEKFVDSPDS